MGERGYIQKIINEVHKRLTNTIKEGSHQLLEYDSILILESQSVFLVGLKSLFEEEQSLQLLDDEREELIRDNTRKLYMAAIRAG